MHQDLAAPSTLESLAQGAALSRATLVRRFRELLDVSPIEYLNQWLLSKAHQLIETSEKSIEIIASEVGFSSGQTLTRLFKRLFGTTPSSLRM